MAADSAPPPPKERARRPKASKSDSLPSKKTSTCTKIKSKSVKCAKPSSPETKWICYNCDYTLMELLTIQNNTMTGPAVFHANTDIMKHARKMTECLMMTCSLHAKIVSISPNRLTFLNDLTFDNFAFIAFCLA